MFKYSLDPFIAEKQKDDAEKLLYGIRNTYIIKHSSKIEEVFDKNSITIELLSEFPQIPLKDNALIIPVIPRNYSLYGAKMDINRAINKINKPWTERVPYIEYSFPPSRPEFDSHLNSFIFFYTKCKEYEEAEELVLYALNKLLKLKMML